MLAPNPDILPQRTKGIARLATKYVNGQTRLDVFYQESAAKIRIPESFNGQMEAVLINTSGGLTGGDRIAWEVAAGEQTSLTVTTQACERIYKSTGDDAHIFSRLSAGRGAKLHWLPQETILFDQSALNRTLDIDLADDAELIALEAVLIGRKAMGETVRSGSFRDRWRIRRGGKLVHAEDVHFAGDLESQLGNLAALAGNQAFATLLYVGTHGEALLAKLRHLLGDRLAGASFWNGKLILRLVASEGFELRKMLIPAISLLRNDDPPPKVWSL